MEIENEKAIKRFLYGEMSDEEQFDFEERFITDSDLFEQIRSVEDELIEKYVRQWMNLAERSSFEKHFLTTDLRRERVEFSRHLISKIEEQKISITAPVKTNENSIDGNVSTWDKVAALFSLPKLATVGALALLIGVLGTWILYNSGNGGKFNVVKNEGVNSETPVAQTTTSPLSIPAETIEPNITTENLPNKTNTETEKSKESPSPTKTPQIAKPVLNPILALFSGRVRSGGGANVLDLPVAARSATLQLNLETLDYKRFQARLTDADGNTLFQKSGLSARYKRINLIIPAKNLKPGDYVVKLFGTNDFGENESVADFQFRVKQ